MADRKHPTPPDRAADSRAEPAPPAAPAWSPGDVIFSLAIVAAVFLAYQPAWSAGLIWNDDALITAPALRSLSGLAQIWFSHAGPAQFHPVLHTAFWIEARLFGDHAAGYHLVSIAVHALNAVLLALILRRLRVPGARLAAGLFALHPLMVQSVAWIAEFNGPLSVAFYLGAVLAYLRFDTGRRGRDYAVALGWFALALLTKTTTATLPAALLVILWWRNGRLSWSRDWVPLLPLFALGAADGAVLAWVEMHSGGAQGPDFGFTWIERGLIAGHVIWFYLGKIFYPASLSFMYPRWIVSQDEVWQFLYPVATALGLVNLWLGRKSRGIVAAVLFFVVTLLPVLGFINLSWFTYAFVADHVAYLAAAGIFVLAGAGAVALRRWLGAAAPVVLGVVLLVSFGMMTWGQSRTYREAESLYRLTITQNPEAWMIHENLGVLLVKKGRYDEAVKHLAQEGEFHPQTDNGKFYLATGLMRLRRDWEAVPIYEELIKARPDDPERLADLGDALLVVAQPRDALLCFQEALRLNPAMSRAQAGKAKAERAIRPGK